MNNAHRLVLCACLAPGVMFTPLQADTIVLKDGQSYSGIIISVQRGTVTIRIEGGSQPRFEKKRIRRIEYSESQDEQKKKRALEESINRQREELRERGQKIARIKEDGRAAETEKARLAALAAETQRQLEEQKKLAALEAEKTKQEEEAAKRKVTVMSLKSEIAALLKEEDTLNKQEEAIQKRREEIQKRKAELNPAFDPLARAKRSAVLPGWGQFTSDRYAAGGIFAFACLASALQVDVTYRYFKGSGDQRPMGQALLSAGGLHRDAASIMAGSRLLSTAETAERRAADSLVLWSFAAVAFYLANVADAYLFEPPAVSDHGRSGRVAVALYFLPSATVNERAAGRSVAGSRIGFGIAFTY